MEANPDYILQAIYQLLKENNEMLKEIVAFIRYLQSDGYTKKDHANQFALNVIADIFVEMLQDDDFKNQIKNSLK